MAGAQSAAGGVVPFGTVSSYGGPNTGELSGPVTGIVADPAGSGYWLVAADGGVFTYGTAGFYGSMGGGLNEAVTGMAATPDGKGYWLADSIGFLTSSPGLKPGACARVSVTQS